MTARHLPRPIIGVVAPGSPNTVLAVRQEYGLTIESTGSCRA